MLYKTHEMHLYYKYALEVGHVCKMRYSVLPTVSNTHLRGDL